MLNYDHFLSINHKGPKSLCLNVVGGIDLYESWSVYTVLINYLSWEG